MRDFLRSIVNLIAWLGAIVGASLPKRWWLALDAYIPASESALASAIADLPSAT